MQKRGIALKWGLFWMFLVYNWPQSVWGQQKDSLLNETESGSYDRQSGFSEQIAGGGGMLQTGLDSRLKLADEVGFPLISPSLGICLGSGQTQTFNTHLHSWYSLPWSTYAPSGAMLTREQKPRLHLEAIGGTQTFMQLKADIGWRGKRFEVGADMSWQEAREWSPNGVLDQGPDIRNQAVPYGQDRPLRYGDELNPIEDTEVRLTNNKLPGIGVPHPSGYSLRDLGEKSSRKVAIAGFVVWRPDTAWSIRTALEWRTTTGIQTAQASSWQLVGWQTIRPTLQVSNRWVELNCAYIFENSGNSYNLSALGTAITVNQQPTDKFLNAYKYLWQTNIMPVFQQVTGYDPVFLAQLPFTQREAYIAGLLNKVSSDSLWSWHKQVRNSVEAGNVLDTLLKPVLRANTDEFQKERTRLISRNINQGGAGLYSQSHLFLSNGKFKLPFKKLFMAATWTVQGQLPFTAGTILADSLQRRTLWAGTGMLEAKIPFAKRKIMLELNLGVAWQTNFNPAAQFAAKVSYKHPIGVFAEVYASLQNRFPTAWELWGKMNLGSYYYESAEVRKGIYYEENSVVQSVVNNTPASLRPVFLFSLRPERYQKFGLQIGYLHSKWRLGLQYSVLVLSDGIGMQRVAQVDSSANRRWILTNRNSTFPLTLQSLEVNAQIRVLKWLQMGLRLNAAFQSGTLDTILPNLNIPRFRAQFTTNITDLSIGTTKGWGAMLSLVWQEGYVYRDPQSIEGYIPGRIVLDLSLRKSWKEDRFCLDLGARNLVGTPLATYYGGLGAGRFLYASFTVAIN
jgi:hypothetical protein